MLRVELDVLNLRAVLGAFYDLAQLPAHHAHPAAGVQNAGVELHVLALALCYSHDERVFVRQNKVNVVRTYRTQLWLDTNLHVQRVVRVHCSLEVGYDLAPLAEL